MTGNDSRKGIEWRQWGDDLFQDAAERDIPILLYFYTVWGRAGQLFERDVLHDKELCALIQDRFLPVRVDVTRRPEIFSRYGRGSWPSICLLTSTGELLLVPGAKDRRTLLAILMQAVDYYHDNRESIKKRIEQSGPLKMPEPSLDSLPDEPDTTPLETALRNAEAYFDRRHGGFGRAPKHPLSEWLLFLLEERDPAIREKALLTLETMQNSALYDHLEGGFFRICDDEAWRIPHFEKLLDANAALLSLYLAAWRLTEREDFLRTASGILSFLGNRLGDENTGLFNAAIDSDSGSGDYGDYYGWTEEELRERLDETVAEAVVLHFGISDMAALPGAKGQCALEKRVPVDQVALRMGIEKPFVSALLEDGLETMRSIRAARPEPAVDDAFFSLGLGRLLSPLAEAAILLEKPLHLQRAFEISDRIWEIGHLREGGIRHILLDDDEAVYLADQAEVILGLLGLYRAAGRDVDYERALQLGDETMERLGCDSGIGCYDYQRSGKQPGALSVLAAPFLENSRWLLACCELWLMSGEKRWERRVRELAEALKPLADRYRFRSGSYYRALRRLASPPPLVEIAAGENLGVMRRTLLRQSPPGMALRNLTKNDLGNEPDAGSISSAAPTRARIHWRQESSEMLEDPEEVLSWLASHGIVWYT